MSQQFQSWTSQCEGSYEPAGAGSIEGNPSVLGAGNGASEASGSPELLLPRVMEILSCSPGELFLCQRWVTSPPQRSHTRTGSTALPKVLPTNRGLVWDCVPMLSFKPS